MIQLSLILPVHNEEDIIESVVQDIITVLKKNQLSYECILVENGSQDNSFKVLKQLAKTFQSVKVFTSSQGYGNAVITGLKHAQGKYLCYMPSDGQVPATSIPKLYKDMEKSTWDAVKIKRMSRESLGRVLTSLTLRVTTRLLFHTPLTDINGSPRIFKRSALKVLKLSSTDSFIDVEFAAKTAYLGWKIKEIPTPNLDRLGGKSTRSYKTYTEFIRNLWNYKTNDCLKNWRQETKLQGN